MDDVFKAADQAARLQQDQPNAYEQQRSAAAAAEAQRVATLMSTNAEAVHRFLERMHEAAAPAPVFLTSRSGFLNLPKSKRGWHVGSRPDTWGTYRIYMSGDGSFYESANYRWGDGVSDHLVQVHRLTREAGLMQVRIAMLSSALLAQGARGLGE